MTEMNREPVAPKAEEAPRKRRPRELMQDFIDDNTQTPEEFGILEMLIKSQGNLRLLTQLGQGIFQEVARLRREKLRLERTLDARTNERNGANNAHKLRLHMYWATLSELGKAHASLEQKTQLLAKRDEQIAKLRAEVNRLQGKRGIAGPFSVPSVEAAVVPMAERQPTTAGN
jgi:hypothetical protein